MPIAIAELAKCSARAQPAPRVHACDDRAQRNHQSPLDAWCRLHAELTYPSGAAEESGGRRRTDPALWEHHVRYAKLRCSASRRALLEAYLGYAAALARRLYRGGEPLEDLRQVAAEALLLALERFDPDRRVPFVSFATPTILGTIKRYYRDQGWAVRVSRRVHDLYGPARQTADRLTVELGRAPTPREVADVLGLEEDLVLEALEVGGARMPVALDAPRPGRDLLPTADRDLRRTEDRVALHQALRQLPERDRELIRLYYQEDLTQSEIAKRRGVSQMQVSRLLAQARRRLRGVLPAS